MSATIPFVPTDYDDLYSLRRRHIRRRPWPPQNARLCGRRRVAVDVLSNRESAASSSRTARRSCSPTPSGSPAKGEAIISLRLTARLVERFARLLRRLRDHKLPQSLVALTNRELDMLRAAARGLSNAEIAAEVSLEQSDRPNPRRQMLEKLNVPDRVQAAILASLTGFVTPVQTQ